MSGHAISSSANNVPSSHGSSTATWNSSKVLLNKETKDKTYLFKSQKYIRDFKGTSSGLNGGNDSSIFVKKEEHK